MMVTMTQMMMIMLSLFSFFQKQNDHHHRFFSRENVESLPPSCERVLRLLSACVISFILSLSSKLSQPKTHSLRSNEKIKRRKHTHLQHFKKTRRREEGGGGQKIIE